MNFKPGFSIDMTKEAAGWSQIMHEFGRLPKAYGAHALRGAMSAEHALGGAALGAGVGGLMGYENGTPISGAVLGGLAGAAGGSLAGAGSKAIGAAEHTMGARADPFKNVLAKHEAEWAAKKKAVEVADSTRSFPSQPSKPLPTTMGGETPTPRQATPPVTAQRSRTTYTPPAARPTLPPEHPDSMSAALYRGGQITDPTTARKYNQVRDSSKRGRWSYDMPNGLRKQGSTMNIRSDIEKSAQQKLIKLAKAPFELAHSMMTGGGIGAAVGGLGAYLNPDNEGTALDIGMGGINMHPKSPFLSAVGGALKGGMLGAGAGAAIKGLSHNPKANTAMRDFFGAAEHIPPTAAKKTKGPAAAAAEDAVVAPNNAGRQVKNKKPNPVMAAHQAMADDGSLPAVEALLPQHGFVQNGEGMAHFSQRAMNHPHAAETIEAMRALAQMNPIQRHKLNADLLAAMDSAVPRLHGQNPMHVIFNPENPNYKLTGDERKLPELLRNIIKTGV